MAELVAAANAPLTFVEDPAAHRAVNHIFQFAREFPNVTVGPDGVPLSAYRTRKTMITVSDRLGKTALARFEKLPAVSITIDAGTIERRHFLDIMLMAPYTPDCPPYLYDTVEKATLSSDDYGEIVGKAILTLHNQHKIEVRSIVGDNLPAQVSALAHWSKKSRLKKKGCDPVLKRMLYSPCLCHFLQLIVGDLISGFEHLQEWEQLLHAMIAAANSRTVQNVCKARCPQTVRTRWLSVTTCHDARPSNGFYPESGS
jgi:hypothetical protein